LPERDAAVVTRGSWGRVNFQESTTVESSTSEDDRIQVMAPGDACYECCFPAVDHDE